MKHFRFLLLTLFVSTWLGAFAQYGQSGSLHTVTAGFNIDEHWSAGAVGGSEPIFRPIYAISNQYAAGSTQCYRTLRVFENNATLKGISVAYSHDHTGVTKILFDPNDNSVIYALYQERQNNSTSNPGTRRTYVRKFKYTPPSGLGMGTITKSNRIEVFNHTNNADFVIAPNGVLLVGAINNSLGVTVRPIYFNGMTGGIIGTLSPTSLNGWVNPMNKTLSMDMKGWVLAIAHDRGNGIYVKKIQYNPGAPGSWTWLDAHVIDGHHHHFRSSASTSGLRQSLGLRPNGDMYYLNGEFFSTNWELIKLQPNGITTVLETGNGDANLVASQNGECFLAHETSGAYQINKYNVLDEHEHTYNVTSHLSSGLNNLAVYDCTLLSSGRYSDDYQKHEKYSCAECPAGGLANAEATMAGNVHHYETPWTYYGPLTIPVYCGTRNIEIDGAASSCETGYYLSIVEWNLNSWTPIGSPLYQGWVCTNCIVPQDIDVASLIGSFGGGVNGRNFHVTLAVGGPGGWNADYELFRLEICKLDEKPFELGKTAMETTIPGPLEGLQDALNAEVFPNPTTGIVNLQVSDDAANTSYQILDLTGKVVDAGNFVGRKTIELPTELARGLYMVKLENANGQAMEKLMVK